MLEGQPCWSALQAVGVGLSLLCVCGGGDHLLDTPYPVCLETLAPAVKLRLVTELLHGLEANTAYMKLSWMCSVDETQTLVVGGTVPWLSWVIEGASAPVALVGAVDWLVHCAALGWCFVGGAILCQTRALLSLCLVT